MRIAVPDTPIFAPLYAGAAACEHELIVTSQPECERLLRTAQVELALLSPLGYGSANPISDYCIVGTTCLIAEECTELAAICFRQGLHAPRTYFAPTPREFITTAGLLLLAEQHELHLTSVSTPEQADTIIAWAHAGEFSDHPARIDLTEEWWLAFECGMPLGVWVCRSELAEEVDLLALTRRLAQPELPHREHLECGGVLQWYWESNARQVLETTLTLLYYHRYLDHMPAVNLIV